MLKKLFVTGACVLAALVSANGQPALKGIVAVSKPAVLDKGILKESDIKTVLRSPYGQDGRKTGLGYWKVFADRKNTTVYSDPEGRTPCGTLYADGKLKQDEMSLRIADIKNGYALVYNDPKNDYPKISAFAISKGWVPLSSLLLWDKGLCDDIGISQKAVICADLDKAGKLKKGAGHMVYKSPTDQDGVPFQANMRFYYILKREAGRVLLGLNSVIKNYNDLFGWVDDSAFVPWNYRTCLEPTWDIDDVEYFTSKYYSWGVYVDKNKMTGHAPASEVFKTAIRKLASGEGPVYAEEYKYRTMPTVYLRYPILDGSEGDKFHCTTFGTLNKEDLMQTAEDTKHNADDDHQKAVDFLKERNIVNIVIVIDGTSSMQPYFNAVKKALNELEKDLDGQRLNVGVMIYRDKEDNAYVTECFPATGGFTEPKNQNLRQWLDRGGKYGVRSVAPGNMESVFYGIDSAIDRFFPASKNMKRQSNIMLVIGDCGDNGKFGISRESLINKLAAQNISLMGFQVTNKDLDDYASFNEQLTYLMRSSIQKRYDAISKTPQRIRPVKLENGRGYDMNNTEGFNFFLGMHRFNPVKDTPMIIEDLTLAIEEIVIKWSASIKYLTVLASDVINNGESEPSFAQDDVAGSELTKQAIIEILGGDVQLYERLKKQNSLISFRGYSYKQKDMRDIFKIVVFFPAGELENLVKNLEKVNEAAKSESADRRPYYDAMMNLAKTAVAQDQISTTSYYAILAKVFGMASYEPKSGYTLDDIVDPNVVPYKEYKKIVKRMHNSFERLQQVTQTKYPFTLNPAGSNDKYYWLPSEYLPL